MCAADAFVDPKTKQGDLVTASESTCSEVMRCSSDSQIILVTENNEVCTLPRLLAPSNRALDPLSWSFVNTRLCQARRESNLTMRLCFYKDYLACHLNLVT